LSVISIKQLLEAGVHFGHQKSRWNPKMKEYIFGERNGIHIIDLQQTLKMFRDAVDFLTDLCSVGKEVLFVGTKRQALEAIEEDAKKCGMHYVTNRWLGGLLTNFTTVQKSIQRYKQLESMKEDGFYEKLGKKEVAKLERERKKLEKNLIGIREMGRLPDALFIIDSEKETIAVKEASKLGIPIIAIVDTNCDPDLIDYVIPGNDDALRSVKLFTSTVAAAVLAGRSVWDAKVEEERLAREKAEKEAATARAAREAAEAERARKAAEAAEAKAAKAAEVAKEAEVAKKAEAEQKVAEKAADTEVTEEAAKPEKASEETKPEVVEGAVEVEADAKVLEEVGEAPKESAAEPTKAETGEKVVDAPEAEEVKAAATEKPAKPKAKKAGPRKAAKPKAKKAGPRKAATKKVSSKTTTKKTAAKRTSVKKAEKTEKGADAAEETVKKKTVKRKTTTAKSKPASKASTGAKKKATESVPKDTGEKEKTETKSES